MLLKKIGSDFLFLHSVQLKHYFHVESNRLRVLAMHTLDKSKQKKNNDYPVGPMAKVAPEHTILPNRIFLDV